MQDYAKQLLSAINQYDADNPESVKPSARFSLLDI